MYLYQPSSFGLGLIQVHRGMIQGVIQNKTCNNIYLQAIEYECGDYASKLTRSEMQRRHYENADVIVKYITERRNVTVIYLTGDIVK